MYDLTSVVSPTERIYSQKKFFYKVHFYNTKMSVNCYLQNIVCMVSDAPTHSKP
jgi:hypothetical protein